MSEEFRTGECDTKARKLLLRFVIDYWLYILHSSAKMSFGSSSHIYAHSTPYIHKSCECAETSDSKVTATARLHKSYIPTIVPEANVASSFHISMPVFLRGWEWRQLLIAFFRRMKPYAFSEFHPFQCIIFLAHILVPFMYCIFSLHWYDIQGKHLFR